MIYVMADLHGCLEEFRELLRKIRFTDQDELYILGDLMDRGPEPIRLIQDLMLRPNVYPILGNHDYMALKVLKKLNVEITDENLESHLSADDLMDYMFWMQDGGDITSRQFCRLNQEERLDLLEYLEECTLYEELDIGERHYILVHAGLFHFDADRALDDYSLEELIFHRCSYDRRYYPDENTYIVSGHTPTGTIRPDGENLIYEANGNIAIDCGCVYGGRLAAYCLDTRRAYYVEACRK